MRFAVALALAVTACAGAAFAHVTRDGGGAYAVHPLVADARGLAALHDQPLVNAWGLAASPTGPWWVSNEASDTSTLYSGSGRKQLLTVRVDGGPTGVVFYGGKQFVVRAGGASDPARFIYACEDGMLRAWTPTVPGPWSTRTEVVVDEAAEAAVFRGLAILDGRVYATDFHNGRVDVYDDRWRRVRRRGAFVDRSIPEWYAPFGIAAIGNHIFVSYVWRAPVNGNDSPTGGYVDEYDGEGRLVARVARGGLNAPWGMTRAPLSFGRFGGDLLIGGFGDGRITAFRRHADGTWARDGQLTRGDGKPVVVPGLWGIAFGNGATAGPRDTLFFASGPHRWRGVTEARVHGLVGSIVGS